LLPPTHAAQFKQILVTKRATEHEELEVAKAEAAFAAGLLPTRPLSRKVWSKVIIERNLLKMARSAMEARLCLLERKLVILKGQEGNGFRGFWPAGREEMGEHWEHHKHVMYAAGLITMPDGFEVEDASSLAPPPALMPGIGTADVPAAAAAPAAL
jgi:hypothetical protein